jgi:SAM-dependent methyltransferase
MPRAAHGLVRAILPQSWRARLHYYWVGEPTVIKRELRGLSGTPWRRFAGPRSTVRMTERVVEIPWVLSRYQGERRVLDVGSANAVPFYLQHLIARNIAELHGVDLSSRRVPGIRMTQADVRHMPFPDASFDLVMCVSTLEHIGLDNRGYDLEAPLEARGDLAAMVEIRRVLDPSGRLLITVPFGRSEDYGWFKQYDLTGWRSLLEAAGLEPAEEAFFRYSTDGWESVDDPSLLASSGYGELGAPAATAVLCADLRPRLS